MVDGPTAREGLSVFGVDELGLDKVDRAILGALCRTFAGRPVGLGTLAVAAGADGVRPQATNSANDAEENTHRSAARRLTPWRSLLMRL